MRHYLLVVALVITLPLTACTEAKVMKDTSSQFYSVTVGATFTLNRQITIPPDMTSVYLQNGKISGTRDIDFYYSNCKFELYTISESERTVQPDTFVVTRIIDDSEASLNNLHFASLALVRGDGPIFLNYLTMMYLKSEKQPDVYRITCQNWDDVADGKYLSIDQMRKALGDVFTLTLAE